VLLAETQHDRLRLLDEESLIELHGRVRRARDKHVTSHRREVGAQVDAARARGVASVPPRRSASKAEIFEAALARVSSSLARAARSNAAALRAERLDAARGQTGTLDVEATGSTAGDPKAPAPRTRSRAPIERKAVASTRATGARRQAKRDAR
jgi:hypothetical protein